MIFDYSKLKYIGGKVYPLTMGLFGSWNKKGTKPIYCHKCRNFANGFTGYYILDIFYIRIPICRSHYYIDETVKATNKLKLLNPYCR